MRRRSVAVLGVLALLSLLLVIRVSPMTAWLRVALDASHGPIFAGVAILLATLLPPTASAVGTVAWPDWRRYGLVVALSVAIGGLVEFLQGFEGRPPSAFDVMTDTAGALVGLALWSFATRMRMDRPRRPAGPALWTVVALGLAGATFVLWRPLHVAAAYAHRAAIFPSIAEFTAPRDLYFVQTHEIEAHIVPLPAPWRRPPGEHALELHYDPAHPPTVQILEPAGDWRGYGVFAADLTNAGPVAVPLVLRILDARHDWSTADRFNLPLVVPARTRTTVRVSLAAVAEAPAKRRMDMAQIANVMLFGRAPGASGTLYVSRFWLE